MDERQDEKELARARALGSAEFQMMTYIVDGKAMSLDEMARYNEEKEARQAKVVEEVNKEIKQMVAEAEQRHVEKYGYGISSYGETAKDFEARLRSEGKHDQADAAAKAFQEMLKANGRDQNGLLVTTEPPAE